jgi:hypothetical protein
MALTGNPCRRVQIGQDSGQSANVETLLSLGTRDRPKFGRISMAYIDAVENSGHFGPTATKQYRE